MSFSNLYTVSERYFKEARTESSPIFFPVGRIVRGLRSDLSWINDILFTPVETRDGDPYGHIEEYKSSGIVRVYYSDRLNECYRRFVWAKELMHLFDEKDAKTGSAKDFKKLIDEIENRPIQPSEMYRSEILTQWMALLVLCPLEERANVVTRASTGETYYSIALDYKIPEAYIGSIISDAYMDAHEFFLGDL